MSGIGRLQAIRKSEREYHDECYENVELFKPGSWLHRPVKTVIDLMDDLDQLDEVNVLDLGSGVGRNSIPIAERLKRRKGKVVCVDLLESAINKLEQYSEQYGVSDHIMPMLSDIADYSIRKNFFDFIFSVSSLEHLDSENSFDRVIGEMINGTRAEGINCIIISTGVKETYEDTGESVEPMYELMFATSYLVKKLEKAYSGWKMIRHTVKPYDIEITREGKKIRLESDVVTWVVQKL